MRCEHYERCEHSSPGFLKDKGGIELVKDQELTITVAEDYNTFVGEWIYLTTTRSWVSGFILDHVANGIALHSSFRL